MDWNNLIETAMAMIPATIFAAAAWRKASQTHEEVNSKMSLLLWRTEESAHAEGVEEERLRNKGQG